MKTPRPSSLGHQVIPGSHPRSQAHLASIVAEIHKGNHFCAKSCFRQHKEICHKRSIISSPCERVNWMEIKRMHPGVPRTTEDTRKLQAQPRTPRLEFLTEGRNTPGTTPPFLLPHPRMQWTFPPSLQLEPFLLLPPLPRIPCLFPLTFFQPKPTQVAAQFAAGLLPVFAAALLQPCCPLLPPSLLQQPTFLTAQPCCTLAPSNSQAIITLAAKEAACCCCKRSSLLLPVLTASCCQQHASFPSPATPPPHSLLPSSKPSSFCYQLQDETPTPPFPTRPALLQHYSNLAVTLHHTLAVLPADPLLTSLHPGIPLTLLPRGSFLPPSSLLHFQPSP